MITFIRSSSPDEGAGALSARLAAALGEGKKTLWLIAGGSNVPIAATIMRKVRETVSSDALTLLTVSQTDERYGPVGHADSNWKQMTDAGFDLSGVKALPILRDMPLDETVRLWSEELKAAFEDADLIIGQFGMGADGHIAGLLPHSPALLASGAAGSHTDEKFTRVSMTPAMIIMIDVAYAFVYGEGKREAVSNLRNKEMTIDDQPAQILKSVDEAYFYTDCLS